MPDTPDIERLDHRKPATASRIVEVQHAAYQVEARLIGFDGIPPLHETASDVMALDLTILAAVEDGHPLAILGYRRTGQHVEIDRLAVQPDQFRRGLARRLIAELHAREADATRFDVSTGKDNLPAVTLYQQLGYRRIADVALPEGVVITTFTREQ